MLVYFSSTTLFRHISAPVFRRYHSSIPRTLSRFGTPTSSILVTGRTSLITILPRNITCTPILLNKEDVVAAKKTCSSKRGPKFRTPSKKKDASTVLGVSAAVADEEESESVPEWNIWAYATADEYQLDQLSRCLRERSGYQVSTVAKELPDVFRLTSVAKNGHENERREIFVFSNGAVVFWDTPAAERLDFLRCLRPFERRPFDRAAVEEECERLAYTFQYYDEESVVNNEGNTDKEPRPGIRNGKFRKEVLCLDAIGNDRKQQLFERYTVSNVMAASVQLAIWESDLENLASSLEEVTQAMNKGKISLPKKAAISYAGRLISLRHNVSLHSDLLDHPDFYWERVGLEKLYDQASEILCIRRRVNVFNKKIDDAMALIDVIMQELAVVHSSRLEWLIIYLICIEVLFDAYHFWRL